MHTITLKHTQDVEQDLEIVLDTHNTEMKCLEVRKLPLLAVKQFLDSEGDFRIEARF